MKVSIVSALILLCFNIHLYAFQNDILTSDSEKFQLRIDRTIQLNEEIEPISDVSHIAIAKDGSFFLTSKNIAQLLLYDSNGNQVKKIGRWGRGPFEYQKPSIIKMYNDKLYLWDQISFKLIIYSSNGEPQDELNLFASNVTDFSVWDSNIIFYSQGSTDDYLSMYNIETKKLLLKSGYEIKDEMEHLLLMMFDGSGNLTYSNQAIYYGLPSISGIVKHSLINNQTSYKSISDENFHLEDSGYKNLQKLNMDIQNAVKYPFFNSRNLGAFNISNYILSINENGLYDPDDIGDRWNLDYDYEETKRRRHTYFIHNSNLNFIDKIEMTPTFQKNIGLKIVGTSGDTIAYLKQDFDSVEKRVKRTITFLKLLKQ